MFLVQSLKSVILDRPLKQGALLADRYEIIRILGMGSYGISYLAKDRRQNKECVVKQMKPSRKKLEKVHRSFEYEKKILSYLNHPQIPSFGESLFYNGQHFFTMDYIAGRTFEDLIFNDGAVFDEVRSFEILRDVLEIVAYFHGKKIIHRDLRIPNIMVKDGAIYVIDFGLARFLDTNNCDNFSEMAGYDFEKKLKREIHYKSDFYALGHFILFLLYSSYTPDSKKERSWEEELQISNQGRRIIRRMLQLDEPYMNIDDVVRDVDKIL